MKSVIFDTETTGLIKSSSLPLEKQPKVIELFALLVDHKWKELDRISILVQPYEKLPPEIIKITGIDDELLRAKGVEFALCAFKFGRMLTQADRVIGHNVTFDIDMVNLDYARIKQVCPWPAGKPLCTVEATEHLKGRRLKLTELYELMFEKKFDNAHRAESDVRATHAVCKELSKRGLI